MRETISIGKINGSEITAIKAEDGTIIVPIKPICTVLGIDDKAQREKISEDEDLSSVGVLSPSTGADGKSYEMLCLPLRYVYGWLFTINPKNVAAAARESVRKYRQQCYDILYDHFEGKTRRQIESNRAEKAILGTIERLTEEEKTIKTQLKEAKENLSKIRASRLDDQPSLFD